MKRTTFLTALSGLILISAPIAVAQTPPPVASAAAPSARQLELAGQVIQATGTEDQMASMFRNMATQMAGPMERNAVSDRQEAVKVAMDAMNDTLAKLVPRIRQDMVDAYAQTFSEQELADMLAFYQSPSGRSMRAKTPQMAAIIVGDMARMMPEIRREMGQQICAKTTCTDQQKAAFFGGAAAKN